MPAAEIVATVASLLLHVPPDVASVNVTVLPGHVLSMPVIVPAAGIGFTVIIVVAVPLPHALVTE